MCVYNVVFRDVFRISFLDKKYYAIELYLSRVYLYSGTCLIWHTKGPGKRVGLYRMSEYSGFILVYRNTLGPWFFVGCHRMSESSGVGLHKFYCTCWVQVRQLVSEKSLLFIFTYGLILYNVLLWRIFYLMNG
jgi:hypothetical protein